MKGTSIAWLAVLLGACGGSAREVATYRADTQQLLATHDDQLKSCYERALQANPQLAGKVTVHFVVERKTGAITKVDVDAAPDALAQCVLDGVKGLVLAPADRNDGDATFVYDFEPAPATPSS